MEQKKTLWIIAATGVFLLVVIGAAMILYSPNNYTAPAVASVTPVRQIPSGGWSEPSAQPSAAMTEAPVSSETGLPATAVPPVIVQKDQPSENANTPQQIDKLTVISGTTNVYGINGIDSGTTTIDLNTIKAAAAEQSTTDQKPAAVTAVTAPVEKEIQKPAAAPAKKTAKPAAVKTPAKAVPLAPKYWVQAASFSAKKLADNARSVLSENKIPAEVFTFTNSKNQVFYRVRVGPYTTKSEAEYWKSKIVQIDEFKDSKSYITDSSAAK